jgi:exodeoxyribonuclease VII small subunit
MTEPTYQQLQAQLETLMATLDDDQLDVDAAITTYEQASKIITQLQRHLKNAENKLKKVSN